MRAQTAEPELVCGGPCATRASRLEAPYFVVARGEKAPPLPPPQHGGARLPTLAARVRRNGQMSAESGPYCSEGRDAHSPVGPADQVGRA
jgi:hypothetical protein